MAPSNKKEAWGKYMETEKGPDFAAFSTLQAYLEEAVGNKQLQEHPRQGSWDRGIIQAGRDLGMSVVQLLLKAGTAPTNQLAQGFIQWSLRKLLQCLIILRRKIFCLCPVYTR